MAERRPPPAPSRYRDPIEHEPRVTEIPIGVVVPFDFELDWEYWRYLPPGVSLYFTRTPFLNQPVGMRLARDVGNPKMLARATRALNSLNPAATLYACSSGSFVNGVAGEAELRRTMLAAGARRAVTTSGAMIDAFNACGIRKLAVATPYSQRLTLSLVAYLEEANIEVTSVHYLGLTRDISTVSRSTIANLVRSANTDDADATFVSCTALRTYGLVASLEAEQGMPVFTSNQVSLWAALDAAGALAAQRPGEPMLGDADPMARSTELLLGASLANAASQPA